MKRILWGTFLGLIGLAGPTVWAQTANPADHLRNFSELKQIDPSRLMGGEILTVRGSLMTYPNGISVESCFAVPTSPEETAKRLQEWDPSPHEALKVYEYHTLSNPAVAADFESLAKQKHHSLHTLLDKTAALPKGRSEFNLSSKEESGLSDGIKTQRTEQNAAACWSKLLLDRAQAFQRNGFKDMPPYQTSGEQVAPVMELRSLVLDQTKLGEEFAPILNACGLLKHTGNIDLSPFYYWSFFDADHHDTFNLGVVYRLPVGDHIQLADIEYFASGGYYVSITLYEVWPITVSGKSGSLVWRDDIISAPMLAYTKGTERIAYGALMLQDIKKSIRFFQEDLKHK